ncbi:MAG TPA: GNAT family N-acetyltransferase [Candidatus Limnocylindria bacterium]
MALPDPGRVAVTPLVAEDREAAAALLAARQRRVRASRPELPARFEDPAAFRPLLDVLLARDGAHGVLARVAGEPAAFLLGYPRMEKEWARAAWSPIEGSALGDGADPELIRDLYAAWSAHFVRRGFFRQYVHASPHEPDLMAAWVRTGFGQMQAHAVRDASMSGGAPTGVTVRRAGPEDIDLVEPLLPLVAQALMRPPAYAMRYPEDVATYRDSWAEELHQPGAYHWLAEERGRALAMASFYLAEPGPMVPDGAWELALAMTLPEERGRGLVRALAAAGFAAAREAGAGHVITDWRTASLPTHRSWTALGFVPTHYRLHRHIDERIAWAAPPG